VFRQIQAWLHLKRAFTGFRGSFAFKTGPSSSFLSFSPPSSVHHVEHDQPAEEQHHRHCIRCAGHRGGVGVLRARTKRPGSLRRTPQRLRRSLSASCHKLVIISFKPEAAAPGRRAASPSSPHGSATSYPAAPASSTGRPAASLGCAVSWYSWTPGPSGGSPPPPIHTFGAPLAGAARPRPPIQPLPATSSGAQRVPGGAILGQSSHLISRMRYPHGQVRRASR